MHLPTFLLSYLLCLLLTPLIAAQTSANFRLQVFDAARGTPNPLFGELDIDSAGFAVFNRTATPGVYNYALNNSPSGLGPSTLFQRGTGKLAFLSPTPVPGIYDLKFAKPLPTSEPCQLSAQWTRQGRGCGGNCGGVDLKYNEPVSGPAVGTFFVVPHGTVAGAYRVMYSLDRIVYPLPGNGRAVLIWANLA